MSNSVFGKIWIKNNNEAKEERKRRKDTHWLYNNFIRFLQLFMDCMSIYVIVIGMLTYIIPVGVSYLGGLAEVSYEADLFMMIASWVCPSLFFVGLMLVASVYLIKVMCKFWGKCFGRMLKTTKTDVQDNDKVVKYTTSKHHKK